MLGRGGTFPTGGWWCWFNRHLFFCSFIHGHSDYVISIPLDSLDTTSAATVQFLQRTYTIHTLYLVLRDINARLWHPSGFSLVFLCSRFVVCGLVRYPAYHVRDRPFASSASHGRDGSRAHDAQSCVSLPTSSTHAICR